MEHTIGPMSLFVYGRAENLAIGALTIYFACAIQTTLSGLNQAIDRTSASQARRLGTSLDCTLGQSDATEGFVSQQSSAKILGS